MDTDSLYSVLLYQLQLRHPAEHSKTGKSEPPEIPDDPCQLLPTDIKIYQEIKFDCLGSASRVELLRDLHDMMILSYSGPGLLWGRGVWQDLIFQLKR